MMRKWVWAILFFFYWGMGSSVNAATEDKPFTYEMMTNQLNWLQNKYKNELRLKSIGYSHFGRNIYAIKLGTGSKNVLLIGAHHGREWLTSLLLMQMLETYTAAYQNHSSFGPYHTDILNEVSIWFVPMLNPDGVAIQQNQIHLFPAEHQNRLMFFNDGWDNFMRWKANGLGIDLNRQYPAGWEALPDKPGFPSYQFYKGKAPLEAAEVKSMINFVNKIQPSAVLSYHTAGREIFWNYKNGKHLKRDRIVAEKAAKLTGYKLNNPPEEACGGGFTDWFIITFHRPAMTIELSYLVGDRHPPLSVFKEEWERNKYMGLFIASEARNIKE